MTKATIRSINLQLLYNLRPKFSTIRLVSQDFQSQVVVVVGAYMLHEQSVYGRSRYQIDHVPRCSDVCHRRLFPRVHCESSTGFAL